jgi:hypothetical protein
MFCRNQTGRASELVSPFKESSVSSKTPSEEHEFFGEGLLESLRKCKNIS